MTWALRGAQFTGGVVAVLLAVYLLYWVRSIIVLVLVAILFAQAISPLVARLRRLGARRAQAVLVIYAALGLGVGYLLWLLAQALIGEVGDFIMNLPTLETKLADAVQAIPIPQLSAVLSQSIEAMTNGPLPLSGGVPSVLQTGLSVVEAIFGLFSVLVIAFYWIAEQLAIRTALLGLLPPARRAEGLRIWQDVENKLGAWVRGQLLLMLAIGSAFFVGLTALGVKYAVLLGAVAACAELLPVIGPWVGTAPAVLIALTQGLPLAFFVLGYGIVVQLIETNVLLPRIVGHVTGISPLVVFLSILVGGELLGVPGALLAVPVAAGLQVLIVDLRTPYTPLPEADAASIAKQDAA